MRAQAFHWLCSAEADRQAAKTLMRARRYSHAVFMAYQAAEDVPQLTRLERLLAEWAKVSPLGADVIGLTPEECRRRAQELSIVGEIAREGIVVCAVPDWVRPVPR